MTIKRKFYKTHPWITFEVDLRKGNHQIWLLLGEAQSKCENISGIPISPKFQLFLSQVYLAKGALATTAIEGNTLTEDEVIKHLEKKLELPPSKEYLKVEIDNVVTACNLIGNLTLKGRSNELIPDEIKKYNKLLLEGLPLYQEVIPGELRTYNVTAGRYLGAPAEDCEYLLTEYCDWINAFPCEEGYELAYGIIKAIIAHIYFAWIHPFGDGNGRTARLIEFQILLTAGVPTTAAHLLSNHYNQTRTEYYRYLDGASRSGGNIFPFVEYALHGYVDQLREQMEYVKNHQLYVHWYNYIHETFRDNFSVVSRRMKHLIQDITKATGGVKLSEIRHVSARIAEDYAGKTEKTIHRDVKKLEDMDLLIKEKNTVWANVQKMRAFLPRRVIKSLKQE
ncbi:Fic family protein [bacterium]|nr:Fic family protein [bacterium]